MNNCKRKQVVKHTPLPVKLPAGWVPGCMCGWQSNFMFPELYQAEYVYYQDHGYEEHS